MKELQNYLDAREALFNRFEINEIYPVEDYRSFKFCPFDSQICWISDGDEYSSTVEHNQIIERDNLFLALFSSDFGDGNYWAVFDSANKLTEEDFIELAESIE